MADKLLKRYRDTLKSKGCKDNHPGASSDLRVAALRKVGSTRLQGEGSLARALLLGAILRTVGKVGQGRWLRGRDGLKGSHCPMPSPHHRADCAPREEKPLLITQIIPGSPARVCGPAPAWREHR